MKKLIFIPIFLFLSYEENQPTPNIKDPNIYSIGFGSCLTQERSMPIFNSIKSENYDLFLMLGDNVYGDSEREDLLELREAYDKQRENFDSLRRISSLLILSNFYDFSISKSCDFFCSMSNIIFMSN